jgi:hypothetical protein
MPVSQILPIGSLDDTNESEQFCSDRWPEKAPNETGRMNAS